MRLAGTNYEKYVQERLDAEILENDNGFLVFKIKDGECFIVEMFIDLAWRKIGSGRLLIEELMSIAKDKNCKILTANVFLTDKGASSTLIAAFKVGFQLGSLGNGCISIFKKIGD